MSKVIYKKDLIYPELSYQIIGILFDIFTALGYGYKEKQYQKAVEEALRSLSIKHKRELPLQVTYKGKRLTTVFMDFLIDEKIILELKQGNRFNKDDIEQVYNYLRASGLKLGLLVRFTRQGVKFMRIVNLYDK